MKLHDRNGNILSDGNFVQVECPGGFRFDGKIVRVDEGGLAMSTTGAVTPPRVIVGFEIQVDIAKMPKGADGRIGQITRLVDPGGEELLSKALRPA